MKANSNREQIVAAMRHLSSGVAAGFNEVIRLDRSPFTARSFSSTWRAAWAAFFSGFNQGTRLYLSPFKGFWHEAAGLLQRSRRRR